jgi:hypothetical protein
VFYSIAALKLKLYEKAVWSVTTVACILAISAFEIELFQRPVNGYVTLVTGFAVGGLLTGVLWPTYLRLVPGRLDVIRYSLLGRGVVECVKHDLRSSAVLVDLNQHCVFLATDGITTEVSYGAVRDPYDFAHAVLLAAVSTHKPAPLPDDALVG